jgi:hypothetical protein
VRLPSNSETVTSIPAKRTDWRAGESSRVTKLGKDRRREHRIDAPLATEHLTAVEPQRERQELGFDRVELFVEAVEK